MPTKNRIFDDEMPKRPQADKQKDSAIILGNISATASRTIFRAPHACTIKRISLLSETTVPQDNGSYWTFQVTNKTQTLSLLSTTKKTDSTGGAITQYTNFEIPVDQNLDLAADDVLSLDATKVGSAALLTNAYVVVEFQNRAT